MPRIYQGSANHRWFGFYGYTDEDGKRWIGGFATNDDGEPWTFEDSEDGLNEEFEFEEGGTFMDVYESFDEMWNELK